MAEKKSLVIEIKGLGRDFGRLTPLPLWYQLKNIYFGEAGEVRGRPHYHEEAFSDVKGIGKTAEGTLIVHAGDTLYINGTPVTQIGGNGPLKYDWLWRYTIISSGEESYIWNGQTIKKLTKAPSTVRSLATWGGAEKARVVFVSEDDPKTLWISAPFNPDDFGEVLTDPRGVADDIYTEGGKIWSFAHEIVGVVEFRGTLFVLSKDALYEVIPDSVEGVFLPGIRRVLEAGCLGGIKIPEAIAVLTRGGIFVGGGGGWERLLLTGVSNELLKMSSPVLSYDEKRRLFFVSSNEKPDSFVLSPTGGWTEWEGRIIQTTSTDKGYALKDSKLVSFVEGQSTTPYKITLQSGLDSFGTPSSPKRFLFLGVDMYSSVPAKVALDVKTQDIQTIRGVLKTALSGVSRVESYIGRQGVRGSITIRIENYGEIIINDTWLTYLEKKPKNYSTVVPL